MPSGSFWHFADPPFCGLAWVTWVSIVMSIDRKRGKLCWRCQSTSATAACRAVPELPPCSSKIDLNPIAPLQINNNRPIRIMTMIPSSYFQRQQVIWPFSQGHDEVSYEARGLQYQINFRRTGRWCWTKVTLKAGMQQPEALSSANVGSMDLKCL